MKNLFLIAVLLFCSSCTSFKLIGTVNMISTRNIDHSANYQVLRPYAGGGEKELKKSPAISIDEAINLTVKNVPGGEYIMNAKIYVTSKGTFAVEGDVWGLAPADITTQRGFHIGDRVQYKKVVGDPRYGKITEFKSFDKCIVQDETSGILKEALIDDLKLAK